ncbi:MAG: cytochrome P450 [Paracrocinitomix sp.]|jgi:cytochrome P450
MSVLDSDAIFAADPEAIRCPYPIFDKLRTESPVYWSEAGECFMITRYDDIVHISTHPALFNSLMPTGPIVARQQLGAVTRLMESDTELSETMRQRGSGANRVLIAADAPEHGQQRQKVSRIFTPRQMAKREPYVRGIANGLIDAWVDQGEVDLVKNYGVLLPLTVIADYLGVERSEMPRFKKWSDDFTALLGNHSLTDGEMATVMRSQVAFFEYFEGLIHERRGGDGDDLVSLIVRACEQGENQLGVPEMLSMLNQFLVAGNETTTKLITSATRMMLEHGLTDTLRNDPSLIPNFLEECLRLEAPVQCLYRQAARDTEIGGVVIPAGSSLMLVYAAANYDEEHFDRPYELQHERANAVQHLAFGKGAHFCIGAALARLEARIAFEVLLERCSTIALSADKNSFEYEPSYLLHGLKELWVTFTP